MADSAAVSATPSGLAPSEMPGSEAGEVTPMPSPTPATFPPYPPYSTEPAPPSVADTIVAGRDLRLQHKSLPRQRVRPAPLPAKPKGPKVTNVKMARKALRAHARCLRKHGAVLTDRLEHIAKPPRRSIIYLWREYAHTLPPETIARLRSMLDADEPFKPDQAYEYFVNLRKTKKRAATMRVNQIKKDVQAMCVDKRFIWARNATVAFARGIQQRLSRPGCCALADSMLRLSNIILEEVCGYMHMRTPSRRCTHPKARFMMEVSDKVAVWIDEILSESEDRMLMMDFDEDDEVEQSIADANRPEGPAEGQTSEGVTPSESAQTTVVGTGETPASTPSETSAATPAETPAPSSGPTPGASPPGTPKTSKNITRAYGAGDAGFADDFLNMMGGGGLLKEPQSAYLKFTGEMLEAFMILTDSMYQKSNEQLLSHGKFTQTYTEGADELKQASYFEATEFNTTLAGQLNKDLADVAKPNTSKKLQPFMNDMVNICSNYLAQHAEFNKDKGPAFRLLIKTMRTKPNEQLYHKEKAKRSYGKAATELEQAKGLENDHDDPNLSQEIHSKLTILVASVTPDDLKTDMAETLDINSKYLSQCAIDEIERGPAFDILIKELEKDGAEQFTPNLKALNTKFAAAYTLKSAPCLTSSIPDPKTAPMFIGLLHRVVDPATPKALQKDMHEVIERCGKYLSAFVRDREKALQLLVKSMKSNSSKELATRNNYSMNYGTAASETETAPNIVPFLPVKDISDEAKGKLSQDVESLTPSELKIAMKCAVQDVAKHLSQPIAMRSGAAGDRYSLNFLAAIKKSLGSRDLFKYKAYGQTYADAAEVLKYCGPLELDSKNEDLRYEINSEMNRGVPSRLAPTIAAGLSDTMNDAAKHLAKIGTEKGKALEHLVILMKEEGEIPLGHMQGYQQTYNDGARRIENSKSLANDKVDKATYEAVRAKLTSLTKNKPSSEYDKHMPEIVEESSKFLSAPFPETESEKRRVLADLMARKGDEELGHEGVYKVTYKEGGEEIIKAPIGVVTAQDELKKRAIAQKVQAVIPEKKLKEILKDSTEEGSAYLTDLIKGRGEAMQVIYKGMKKESEKDFINVGKFKKNHGQAAEMLNSAQHFGDQNPSPVLIDQVTNRVKAIPKEGASSLAKEYMEDASSITSDYIAGVATKECGLNSKDLATLDSKKFDASSTALRSGTSAITPTARSSVPFAPSAPSSPSVSATTTVPISKPKVEPGSGTDSDAERKRREEEERKSREEGEKKRRQEEERRRREEEKSRKHGDSDWRKQEEAEFNRNLAAVAAKEAKSARQLEGPESDPEREQAMQILHKQLHSRGGEVFYRQPHTQLTHTQASEWLVKPPMKIDKTVKDSADAARLHKKFERKLSAVVSKSTPADMHDTMQDVVIESSRQLSEYFVSKNYTALVREALISEMQRRGNEIIVEVDGAAETFFFAAQRLKKAKTLEVKEPCNQVAYSLTKKLDEMIRCRSMARKLTATMKDHIKDAADYLSELVTKPDDQIEAYVSLIGEMEIAGDASLIEGNIPKSYKDAAAYLRQLTSFEDQIRKPNSSLQPSTESKLKSLMTNVTPRGYTRSVMDKVINDSTRLLVSYIMLQGEKTEALKIVIEQMDEAGENVLLRHGSIRKSYIEGANMLRGKNTDQLRVPNTDPVVTRKIQIKLNSLMHDHTPNKYQTLMDDVIEDTTMYLAVHFLRPEVIQVCKCMKSVFVQCELWCDEILRRVARPCCTCSRHVSAQALADLAPAQILHISPGSSRAFAPGLEITITPCPSKQPKTSNTREGKLCPAAKPTSGCETTTSYLMYSTALDRDNVSTRRLPRTSKSPSLFSDAERYDSTQLDESGIGPENDKPDTDSSSFHTPPSTYTSETSDISKATNSFWRTQTTMSHAKVHTRDTNLQARQVTESDNVIPRTNTSLKSEYSSRAPIISTDQMADWHAMMVSLMWNVQAWRDWIQENINRALTYQRQPIISPAEAIEIWTTFQRRIATETLQWHQYNTFSRQLILRLALRYRDKQIVSPTRATVKTRTYMECHQEMLEIIDMFNKWTKWLSAVVKETNSLQETLDADLPLHELRWNHFKKKVEEYSEDWIKYNMHLKDSWENKYRSLIVEWWPAWHQPGPVWVVSACGAVPSGAVAAGMLAGEVTWVARAAHRGRVLPAALRPSRRCCTLYADGAVHHYDKYQVLCNAEVTWVAWRAGAVGALAVRVAPGVHVGRVHYRGSHLLGAVHAPNYRCHVVIFGRPFAFNCYELLVLSPDDDVL